MDIVSMKRTSVREKSHEIDLFVGKGVKQL